MSAARTARLIPGRAGGAGLCASRQLRRPLAVAEHVLAVGVPCPARSAVDVALPRDASCPAPPPSTRHAPPRDTVSTPLPPRCVVATAPSMGPSPVAADPLASRVPISRSAPTCRQSQANVAQHPTVSSVGRRLRRPRRRGRRTRVRPARRRPALQHELAPGRVAERQSARPARTQLRHREVPCVASSESWTSRSPRPVVSEADRERQHAAMADFAGSEPDDHGRALHPAAGTAPDAAGGRCRRGRPRRLTGAVAFIIMNGPSARARRNMSREPPATGANAPVVPPARGRRREPVSAPGRSAAATTRSPARRRAAGLGSDSCRRVGVAPSAPRGPAAGFAPQRAPGDGRRSLRRT